MDENPCSIQKTTRSASHRRLRHVDFDKLHDKLCTVLDREADRLLDISFEKKLTTEETKDLSNYLKLLQDLKKSELEELNKMSDEELEALAKQGEQNE